MTRVLVVARSREVRTRLEAALARRPGVFVAGAAGWTVNDDAQPHADVVLLALEEGEAPLLEQRPTLPGAACLMVLGPEPVERWASEALRRGARAALPLDLSPAELGVALDAVAAGLAVLSPHLATGTRSRSARRVTAGDSRQPLSQRELEILSCLAAGLGNKAIAARLGISGHTVKTHVVSLFEKLGVSTRAEAVAAGVQRGILML
ncbi:MAG TPA: response regulator transcription factor [Gemmatimonadales bacterium]|nr:response regulator transcription factor [Gemmatimonadales bacterium]